MSEFKLRIDGMHCGSCVGRVTQALATTKGITVGEVHIGGATLTATEDPPPVDLALTAVAEAGFTAHLDT